MIANDAKIDGARRQRSELGRHGHARQYIESLFLQVANARRKAEAQEGGWNEPEKHEHGASNELTELLARLRGG